MRILLDTHCWLWLQIEPERFSREKLKILEQRSHDCFLSAASCWELSIKWAIGKMPLPEPPDRFVPVRLERQDVLGLPISLEHALRAGSLPMLHRDPFDRLLIAQAQLEDMSLLTADAKIQAYPDVELIQV